MGQKVHPIGFRLGITKEHQSVWYAPIHKIGENILEDKATRDYLSKRLDNAMVSKIEIKKTYSSVIVTVHTARPGLVIGKKGTEVEKLNKELQLILNKQIKIYIKEIKNPELDAKLVGKQIAQMLEKRMPFRRVLKRAVLNTMKMGAKGIKIKVSGRLGGAEMARSEEIKEGRIPLQTLRSDIDYAIVEAHTIWGTIGVKVWIYKGELKRKRIL